MKALYCDKAILAILNEQTQMSVHSVFNKGINLQIDGQDTFVFIYMEKNRLLPNGLCLSLDDFMHIKKSIHKKSRIYVDKTILYVENQPIFFGENTYSSKLDGEGYIDETCFSHFEKILQTIPLLNGFSCQISDMLPIENWQSFMGKGSGLTPSGDDMIVGMLAASYFFKESVPDIRLKKGLTTDISQHYLILAKENRFDSALIQLVRYLENKSFYKIKDIIDLLLNYGHTSGLDVLTGFYCFLNSQMKVSQ